MVLMARQTVEYVLQSHIPPNFISPWRIMAQPDAGATRWLARLNRIEALDADAEANPENDSIGSA